MPPSIRKDLGQANAGWPEQVGGASCIQPTRITSAIMPWPSAKPEPALLVAACGTTPQHIAAMHKALAANLPGCDVQVLHSSETMDSTEALDGEPASRLSQQLARGEFVISAEMDPPRGLSHP